ncbi:MAG: hypothetical protein JF597_00685 [Streptomyces sp.]|uniref:hypothetical protein n=1 Tax=Streptomyces sp. TaxID=1931 RepID=UPI0025CD43BB|nr:hypothetical protein [Streptomyces sp.]MBW8792154.1 hypothetical protein [Streptomyces sp.]
MTNPAQSAGPNGDGSQSLAKESKVGAAVQMLVTTLLVAGLTWVANLDTDNWTGVLGVAGSAVVAAVAGLAAAYRQANR